MKPGLQDEDKKHNKLWIVYSIIFVICTIGIGIALYFQFFQDQKIEIVFGITDSEEEDKYNELKSEFNTIFTNDVEKLQEDINVQKIKDNGDIVVTAYEYDKNEDNYTLNVAIPYINIDHEEAKKIDQEVNKQYKEKAETILKQTTSIDIIYMVEYKAYVQNNILSLVIRSELKEGTKSQKITIQTYNYDLAQNKQVTLQEMLSMKNIDETFANNKIKDEIKTTQEQNQALVEQGYNIYERDYNSDIYKIENTSQYFMGKDGMLYLIYAYGNEDYTSEMDIVIFE